MDFPVFETQRLSLSPLREHDTEAIFQLFSDPEVIRYYDLDVFENREQAKKLIHLFQQRFEQSQGIRWAVRDKTGHCIGTCGFNSWNKAMHSTVIGYDLNRSYWNQGLMSEALFPIITSAFKGELICSDINRIQADTFPANIASERVLVKLGFIEEGLRRQCAYFKNQFHDLKCFGLLKQDFLESTGE